MQPPPIYHLALALALVIGWSSFDAPLLQWPFGGASRREPPVHCLVHVERPFVASKLRTWVTWHPNELANFHVLFLFSSIPPPESQKTRYRCGICSRFLDHDVSYLFFFPKVESTIAFAWRCHLVCLVDNCLLIILNYFKKLEAPNDAHTLASERSCQNSTFCFSSHWSLNWSPKRCGINVPFVQGLWAMMFPISSSSQRGVHHRVCMEVSLGFYGWQSCAFIELP